MCGVVGIASIDIVESPDWLMRGCDAMTHRGPDDRGLWWSADARVGFGHRRLAIIDLSAAGHQPMLDQTGELCIVFNGEIYNFADLRRELSAEGHGFRSQTDTEVVLAAYREWGADCLMRLNGMFAFALYDSRRQMLLLARDRAGEKPLFYHHAGGTLRFASELKALLADPTMPRRIDPESLDCFLGMGFIPGGRCMLQGYNKLPPAHALRFDLRTGDAKIWRYWQLPGLQSTLKNHRADETLLIQELEPLLQDAVRRQLVADVPVGILLSGGVDSSLITAMAVRTTSKVKTFTVRFPGHGKLDETEHARIIAKQFNTEHIELDAQPPEADILSRLAAQFDEPIIDSSMIPTFLVTQVVRQHCKVALGGDGGDELFGGYNHYSRLLWMQSRLGWVPRAARLASSMLAERMLAVGMKGRNWLQGLGADLQRGLPLVASYFDTSTRRRLMANYGIWPTVAETMWINRILPGADLMQRATRTDFSNYLAEDILVKVDRASMLNSLEIRAPFLDHRLIEFAFSKVPSYLKATPCEKKILLKRLAKRILPPQFDRNRKQGFVIPMTEWLKAGPFRDLYHSVLLNSNSIFHLKTIRKLLKNQDRGYSNGERLFGLVLFELWRRKYTMTL